MTTTTLNDTLVQLETLYNAYNEILDQAKAQLESFDVTDAQIGRVAEKLESSEKLQEAAKQAAITDFAQSIAENDLDFWRGRQFVSKISDLVVEQVKDEINTYMRNLLNEQKIIDMIDNRLAMQVSQSSEIVTAIEAKRALKKLIDTLDK